MEKRIIPELKFYKVDKDYLTFLHDEDKKANGFSCVPTMNYSPYQKEKFMCGIVLKVGEFDYFAPVSSYTKKQQDNILLYDNENYVTSTIRLNFMFPVPRDMRKLYNFGEETDERYRSVVRQELKSANSQREEIQKQAIGTYLIVRKLIARGRILKWACNFPCLEKLCREWEKTKGNTQLAQEAEQIGQVENKIRKEKLTPADEEVLARMR